MPQTELSPRQTLPAAALEQLPGFKLEFPLCGFFPERRRPAGLVCCGF